MFKKKRKRVPVSRNSVITELRSRAKLGRSLASGDNRGDWLYSAAVRVFGSWGGAVEAAGFVYGDVRRAALSADDVLTRIRRAAKVGEPLRAGADAIVAAGARRHFGSWRAAVEAAGCELPSGYKWTADDVIKRIRDDHRRGLSVKSNAVIRRNQALYGAARRRFGCWADALAAAIPSVPRPRRGRPRNR